MFNNNALLFIPTNVGVAEPGTVYVDPYGITGPTDTVNCRMLCKAVHGVLTTGL